MACSFAGYWLYINRKSTLLVYQQLENKSPRSTVSTLRVIDDRCTVRSHFLCSEQRKGPQRCEPKKAVHKTWNRGNVNPGVPLEFFFHSQRTATWVVSGHSRKQQKATWLIFPRGKKEGFRLVKLHAPRWRFPACMLLWLWPCLAYGFCGRMHSPVSNFTTAWVQMSYGERN